MDLSCNHATMQPKGCSRGRVCLRQRPLKHLQLIHGMPRTKSTRCRLEFPRHGAKGSDFHSILCAATCLKWVPTSDKTPKTPKGFLDGILSLSCFFSCGKRSNTSNNLVFGNSCIKCGSPRRCLKTQRCPTEVVLESGLAKTTLA